MRKAWGVGVLLVVAISAFAVAQKGPKERDSTRGEPFRVVVVGNRSCPQLVS